MGLTGAMMRRQRILTEDEMKSVWHAASDAGMFGVLVKLLLATAQRRDDWAEAKWSELSGLDSDYPLLTVPTARYKVGRVHEVLLPPLGLLCLEFRRGLWLAHLKFDDWRAELARAIGRVPGGGK